MSALPTSFPVGGPGASVDDLPPGFVPLEASSTNDAFGVGNDLPDGFVPFDAPSEDVAAALIPEEPASLPNLFPHDMYGLQRPPTGPIRNRNDVLATLSAATTSTDLLDRAVDEYELRSGKPLPDRLEDISPLLKEREEHAGKLSREELLRLQEAEMRNIEKERIVAQRAQDWRESGLSFPQFLEREIQEYRRTGHRDPFERITDLVVDSPVMRGAASAGGDVAGLIGKTVARTADAIGSESAEGVADAWNRQRAFDSAQESYLDSQSLLGETLARNVKNATGSVLQSTALAGVGGLPAIVGSFATQAADEGLTEAKDAGLSDSDAVKHALTVGAIEGTITGGMSAIGLGGFEKSLMGLVGRGSGGHLLKNMVSELTEEGAIAVGQQFARYMNGIAEEAIPSGQEAMDIALSTMLSVGAMHGSQVASQALAGQLEHSLPDHVVAMAEQVTADLNSESIEDFDEGARADEAEETSSEAAGNQPVPYMPEKPIEQPQPKAPGLAANLDRLDAEGLLDDEALSGLRDLAANDPTVAQSVFDEAKRKSAEHNEEVRLYREEFKRIFGDNYANSRKKANAAADKGNDSIGTLSSFDLTLQPLLDDPNIAPRIYYEASSLGNGDMEHGLFQLLQLGQKHKAFLSPDDFIAEVTEEALTSFVPVGATESEEDFDFLKQAEQSPHSRSLGDRSLGENLEPQIHEHSSTQVNLPESIGSQTRAIASRIPDSDLAGQGRETEPHVTVKYGLDTNDVQQVRDALSGEQPVEVTLGKTSVFEADASNQDRGDVVKVEVQGEGLHRLNKKLADAIPNQDQFPEYKPHVTLAYVKPGLGKKYEGDGSVEGQSFTINSISFRDREGNSIEVPLGERARRRLGDRSLSTEQLEDSNVAAFASPDEIQDKRSIRQSRSKQARQDEGSNAEPVAAQDILTTWERIFNVPLRAGGFSQRAEGLYKRLPQVVRTKEKQVANLAVAAHEIAHHIDEETGLTRTDKDPIPEAIRNELAGMDYEPQKGRVFEGFAEFLRHWITENDAAHHSPQFAKWFEEDWLPRHPEWASSLQEAKLLARQFGDQSVFNRIQSLISDEVNDTDYAERWKQAVNKKINRLMANQVDQFHMLKQIQEEARSRGHTGKGAYDTTMHYTMTAAPNAEKSLEHGAHSIRTGKPLGGPALWDASKHIASDQEQQEAIAYAYARHTVWMHRRNPKYNTGMDVEDANVWLQQMQDEGKSDRYEEFSKVIADYGNSLLDMLVDAGAMSVDLRDTLVARYGDHYFPLHRVKEESPGVFAGSGFVNLPAAVGRRSREGSGRKIVDPFDAMLTRTLHDYNRAIKARQMESLVRTLDPRRGGVKGMGGFMDEVDAKRVVHEGRIVEILGSLVEEGVVQKDDARAMRIASNILRDGDVSEQDLNWFEKRHAKVWEGKKMPSLEQMALKEPDVLGVIALWRDDFTPSSQKRTVLWHDRSGEPVLYEMDDDLYRIATSADSNELGAFTNALRSMQSAFKAGAAGASSLFAGVNLFADYVSYQGRAKHVKGLRTVYKPWKALGEYLYAKTFGKENAKVELFEELGGNIYSRLSDDSSRRRVRNRSLSKGKYSLPVTIGEVQDAAAAGLSAVQQLVSWSDVPPRLAEMEAAVNEDGYFSKGSTWVDTNGDAVDALPESTRIKAGLAAANATINFKRGGTAASIREAWMPFARATINASYHHGQLTKNLVNIRKSGEQGDLARRYAMFHAAAMAGGVFAYWAMRHDDDDYREMASHDRRRYWTYGADGKTILKMPKPRDEAIVLNMIEGVLDSYYHPDDAKSVVSGVIADLGDRIPTGGGLPLGSVEAFFGWDTFRQQEITPPWLANKAEELQYDNYTTEASKRLSEWGGNRIGMNPKEFDHLLDSATGGAFRRWADLTESAAADAKQGEVRSLGTRNIPFVGRMLPNRHQAASVNDFYDRILEVKKLVSRDEHAGKKNTEHMKEATKLNSYAELMAAIRMAEPKDFKGRRGYKYQGYLVGLSREALGREPLEANPSPFSEEELPEEITTAIANYAAGRARRAVRSLGRPKKAPQDGRSLEQAIADWEQQRAEDEQWLMDHKDNPAVQQAISEAAAKENRPTRRAHLSNKVNREIYRRWSRWNQRADAMMSI
ncbi:MAG: LPD38 domain-containing protein [Pseudomonadota bacterium]